MTIKFDGVGVKKPSIPINALKSNFEVGKRET